MIACADLSDNHNVFVYKISGAQPELIKTERGGPSKILHLCWNQSKTDPMFCTVGPKHCYFWSPKEGTKKKAGTINLKDENNQPYENLNYACVAYFGTNAVTGGSKGEVVIWQGTAAKLDPQVHSSVVHCIRVVNEAGRGKNKEDFIISGGKDSRIVVQLIKKNLELEMVNKILTPDTYPRAVDMMGSKVLAGLRNGRIIWKDIKPQPNQAESKMHVIIYSHHEGEVWGLCELEDQECFVTSGDDNKIIKWNIQKKQCVEICKIKAQSAEEKKGKPKIGKFKGGASTLSCQPPECQSRAVAYDPNSQHLAVAQNNGSVSIRDMEKGMKTILDQFSPGKAKQAEWIECMAYNKAGDKLAIGSHNNNIYIYGKGVKYEYMTMLKGHSSFITCLDWSLDGGYLRSNCGAYELLYFDAKTSSRVTPSQMTSVLWATETCKFGWCVEGIYPSGTDGTHINGVDMTSDKHLIATGDDYGLVNFYRNPAREEHLARSYRGHSEHVTRVKFVAQDKFCISTGGYD